MLTEQEQQEIATSFAGINVDASLTTADEGDLIWSTQFQCSKRTMHYIYHTEPDTITIFRVDDAPPPIEITKINNLIENNQLFRSLINN
jgi:hypothetical protein